MTPGNLEDWLTEYASGSLSHGKERALFAAAMEDQDLFNSLMDQHAIREMLDQPEARQELARWLAREMQEPSSWFRVRNWLAAPRGLVLVGASAILLLGVFANGHWHRSVTNEGISVLSEGSAISPTLRAALALPPRTVIGLEVSLNHDGHRPLYHPGERLRFWAKSAAEGQLIGCEAGPNGGFRVLMGGEQLVKLEANHGIYLPPEGQSGIPIVEPAGPRKVRLILLPAGMGLPRAEGWLRIAGRITIVDLEYQVEAP